MNKKVKTGLYLVIGILGIVFALAGKFVLKDFLSDSQSSVMIGVGVGLFVFGISKWCFGLWIEKNPELMKQNEIEANDERNQFIRLKAQALSGKILHWLLMVGAWVGIVIDVSLWTILLFVGTFLLKTILDFILMAYYQRKM